MNQSNTAKSQTSAGQQFPAPIGKLLGLMLTSKERGRATIEFEADERHANPMRTLLTRGA